VNGFGKGLRHRGQSTPILFKLSVPSLIEEAIDLTQRGCESARIGHLSRGLLAFDDLLPDLLNRFHVGLTREHVRAAQHVVKKGILTLWNGHLRLGKGSWLTRVWL
jgi:hypothetical protein